MPMLQAMREKIVGVFFPRKNFRIRPKTTEPFVLYGLNFCSTLISKFGFKLTQCIF